MKTYYQRIYDALKGKNFSSIVSGYKSTLSSSKTKLSAVESTIESSQWIEKGLEIIKGSVIPSLKAQIIQLERGFDILSNAMVKSEELASQVEGLKKLEEDKESYGPMWTYVEGGSKTKEDVDYHNYILSEIENKITVQEKLISDTIVAINAISFGYNDVSSKFGEYMTDLKKNTDFAAQKAQFLGTMDDGNWYIDPEYATKAKKLELFDNTTGQILKEGDSINMKVGETRILTVKMPRNAGKVKQVIRTSASGDPTFMSGHVVKAQSDINPDPNVIERVNYKYGIHWPKDKSILRTNYYDWIITATEEGNVTISQTCEYKAEGNNGIPKAMVDISVNVTS